METRGRDLDENCGACGFCFARREGFTCCITGCISSSESFTGCTTCEKSFAGCESFACSESSGDNESTSTEDHSVMLRIK